MNWETASPKERLREILKAQLDPLYFQKPHFLNIELFPVSKKIVTDFYNGDYNELVLVAGMRSGKTTLLSFFAAYETFLYLTQDYIAKYGLARGTPVFGLLAAAKEEQAKDTVLASFKARLHNSPFFEWFGYLERSDYIFFPEKNFMVRAVSSSSATEVGRTAKFVCIDEMSRLEETEGPRGGLEVYRALTKATRTFKEEGHRFIVGSPRHTADILMKLFRNASSKTLTVKYATWEMNPNISFDDLKDEFERDPLGAWRDYGADPQVTVQVYFRDPSLLRMEDSPNIIEMIRDGIPVEPEPVDYVLAGDPALKHDAFGLCVAHMEDDVFIVDGVAQIKPEKEINPYEIKELILKIVETLGIKHVVFDTWHFAELQKELEIRGVHVYNHIVRRPDYDRLKEYLYNKKAVLIEHPVLRRELEQLIIKPSGKIDHPRGGSKDVADAVVNALWLATSIPKERVCFGLVRGV